MTYEGKLRAMGQLGDTILSMDSPGEWHVIIHAEICRDGEGLHKGRGRAIGESPEAAVETWWREQVETLPEDGHLLVNPRFPNSKRVKWGGRFWTGA